jgi:hypothetical protein
VGVADCAPFSAASVGHLPARSRSDSSARNASAAVATHAAVERPRPAPPLRRLHMRSAASERAPPAGDHTTITCDVVANSPGLAVVAEQEAKNTAPHRFAPCSPRLRAHGLGACNLPG